MTLEERIAAEEQRLARFKEQAVRDSRGKIDAVTSQQVAWQRYVVQSLRTTGQMP